MVAPASTSTSALSDWLARLDDEQQTALREAPLADRVRRLAEFTSSTPGDVLKRLSALTNLPNSSNLK